MHRFIKLRKLLSKIILSFDSYHNKMQSNLQSNLTMEQHIFCIFIEYRGHHRKGVADCYASVVKFTAKTWVL